MITSWRAQRLARLVLVWRVACHCIVLLLLMMVVNSASGVEQQLLLLLMVVVVVVVVIVLGSVVAAVVVVVVVVSVALVMVVVVVAGLLGLGVARSVGVLRGLVTGASRGGARCCREGRNWALGRPRRQELLGEIAGIWCAALRV